MNPWFYLVMFIIGCIIFVTSNELTVYLNPTENIGSPLNRVLYGSMLAGLTLACLSIGMAHHIATKTLGWEGHMLTGFFAILIQLKIIFRRLKTIVTDAL